MLRFAIALVLPLSVAACAEPASEPTTDDPSTTSGGGGKGDEFADGGTPICADAGDVGDAGCADAGEPPAVPANADELFEFLSSGHYLEFEGEATPHHFQNAFHAAARTFLNPTLAESMRAGNMEHPVGSASVKELWVDDQHTGWVVSVKLADSGRDKWWWYENLSTTDAMPTQADFGGLCNRCHAGGTDFVLTEFPFPE